MSKEQLLGIIRHVLTFAGGILMAKGMVTEGWVSDVVGALMTLIGSIWSVADKK
jgi:hypothetical protein